jgi:rod shape determining protein RodA
MSLIQSLKERLKGIPWGLLFLVYILIAIGLANLYSATAAGITPDRFQDQFRWVLLGTASVIFWGVILDIRTIERLTVFGYIIICCMLLAVDVIGQVAKGAQRWLVMGPIRVQPSEFAKFMIILIVARSFSSMKGVTQFSLLSLWRQFFLIIIPFIFILLQPDLGTAGLVLMIACFIIAFVRVDWKSIMIVAGISAIAPILAWNFVLYDYQKQRVLNFINPMNDPRGTGYHSIQSMIAVGSGGMWGRGFQQGTQSQLSFLPERHTDFVFSVLAEEHGFMGSIVTFSIFLAILVQCFQISEKARDTFSSLVALGVAGFILFHFVINVAMVLGLFPVVGVPLTFVSYGGTHMLTALSCIGLLVAVERRRATSST